MFAGPFSAREEKVFSKFGTLKSAASTTLLGLPLLVLGLSVCDTSPELNRWVLGIYAIIAYILLMRRLRVDWLTLGVQVAGLLCYAMYTSYTSTLERNPDALAQLRYFSYVKKNLALPPPSECLVCNHPPLYYALLASWSALNGVLEVLPGERVLQILSLLLSAAYVALVPLTLRRFTTSARLVALGTALVAFWPSTVMQSCRIHNDSLAKLLMLAGLYWLIRWYQDDRPSDLAISALFAGLSILTKSSGYVLVTTWCCLLLGRALLQYFRQTLRPRRLWPVLVLAVGLVAVQLTSRTPADATTCEHLFGQACKHRGPKLPLDWSSYVYLDLNGFIATPYLVVGKENLEYRYFPNCLIKSSLFGMHTARADSEIARGYNPKIAGVLNYVLLALLLYVLPLFAARPNAAAQRHAPAIVFVVTAITLLVTFRLVTPIAYHSDFRHVQPLLVVLVIFLLDAIQWHSGRRKCVAALGGGLAMTMIVGSVLHWIPKDDEPGNHPTQEHSRNQPRR